MPAGGSRSLCAVRAVGALCAECGVAGKAWSCAAQPGEPPWSFANPMDLCEGACAKRTVETFAALFGSAGLQKDKDGRWTGAAAKLHHRAADVKKALEAGSVDAQQLHASLSHHAWNESCLRGTTLEHTADGECPLCAAYFPREYEALRPQLISKGGRPPKKKRQQRDHAGAWDTTSERLTLRPTDRRHMSHAHVKIFDETRLIIRRNSHLTFFRVPTSPGAQVLRSTHLLRRRQTQLRQPMAM